MKKTNGSKKYDVWIATRTRSKPYKRQVLRKVGKREELLTITMATIMFAGVASAKQVRVNGEVIDPL